jgi:hypothetical protein
LGEELFPWVGAGRVALIGFKTWRMNLRGLWEVENAQQITAVSANGIDAQLGRGHRGEHGNCLGGNGH